MRILPLVFGVLIAMTTSMAAGDALPAFPGAEGFGAQTPGGRGGRVIEVTNLNDRGPGSLRAAVEAEGPRLVVFRVAGTIEVNSPLQILHPFITVAGQTAPGGGITLKNGPGNLYAPLQIKTHDVVVRYLRSRPGPSGVPPAKQDGSNVDALTLADLERDVFNVVIDHCSFSWSVDEVVNVWYDAADVTVQWCIMSEGLHEPRDRKGAGSKGPLFGGKGSGRISIHHNLMAHNVGRNPMIKATGLVDVVNNVVFVPQTVAAVVDGELGPCHVNFVGNTVIAPNGDGLVYGVQVLGPRPVTLFVQSNHGPHRTRDDLPESLFVSRRNQGHSRIIADRKPAPAITTVPAAEAYEPVLRSAGCAIPMRDAVDERIVADVKARRTRIVNDPSEVGGWPNLPAGNPPADSDHDGMSDAWEERHGLNPNDPQDGPADQDGDGYTNVEEFLNSLAARATRSEKQN
jgi:pectate lyase